MANKILASAFSWLSNNVFASYRIQKTIQSTSQFNDGGARKKKKKCCSSQTFGEKRKTVQRGYDAHK